MRTVQVDTPPAPGTYGRVLRTVYIHPSLAHSQRYIGYTCTVRGLAIVHPGEKEPTVTAFFPVDKDADAYRVWRKRGLEDVTDRWYAQFDEDVEKTDPGVAMIEDGGHVSDNPTDDEVQALGWVPLQHLAKRLGVQGGGAGGKRVDVERRVLQALATRRG